MTAPLVAALLAGLGAWLLVPGRPAAAGRPTARFGRPAYLLLVPGAAGIAWRSADEPRLPVVGAIAVGTVFAATRLAVRHREDRAAAAVRAKIVELCEGLQAELAAGQTASTALERASADWPAVAAVSRTGASGGDVPTAFRELATMPGGGDLRVIAAAWQVVHRTGHGLGDAVGRVADELREAERARRVVAGELASARATARLVAALPLVALLMGSGAGGDPWSFLFGHPVGLACLAGGLAFGLAGLAWIEALARDVERGR